MNYWLLKSEPDVFGITDLQKKKISVWDGVRNYQARNYLRTAQTGDLAFFYHSSTGIPGIAGLCEVVETMLVDPTQFDKRSAYFDPRSTPENPRWHTVSVKFVRAFPRVIPLEQLKAQFTPDELIVVRKGNRLSVTPVAEASARRLLALEPA
jgi:predicted RNA-binding protein with PUA-like domain